MSTTALRQTLTLCFPSDLGYIPAMRKFVADVLTAHNFSSRYIYRSEIIVDEVCHNAVMYGSKSIEAEIVLIMHLTEDTVEFFVQDEGGSARDVQQLKSAVEKPRLETMSPGDGKIGLEIVKMFAEELDFAVGEDNLTSVRIVRKRDISEAK